MTAQNQGVCLQIASAFMTLPEIARCRGVCRVFNSSLPDKYVKHVRINFNPYVFSKLVEKYRLDSLVLEGHKEFIFHEFPRVKNLTLDHIEHMYDLTLPYTEHLTVNCRLFGNQLRIFPNLKTLKILNSCDISHVIFPHVKIDISPRSHAYKLDPYVNLINKLHVISIWNWMNCIPLMPLESLIIDKMFIDEIVLPRTLRKLVMASSPKIIDNYLIEDLALEQCHYVKVNLPRLRRLKLKRVCFKFADLSPSITDLEIICCTFDRPVWSKNLRTLILTNCHIEFELPDLEVLIINKCSLHGPTTRMRAAYISIRDTSITHIPLASRNLVIINATLTMENILQINKLPITNLALFDCRLNDEKIAALDLKLRHLDIRHNSITEVGIKSLKKMNLKSIKCDPMEVHLLI